MAFFWRSIFFCLTFSVVSWAQDRYCGAHFQSDPDQPFYRQSLRYQSFLGDRLQHKKRMGEAYAIPGVESVYEVPLVIHILHLGEQVGTGTNLSDADIDKTVNALNEYFRNIGKYFNTDHRDIGVQFVLAKRNTSFKEFSGILRYEASSYGNSNEFSYSEAIDELTNPYPTRGYINVWLVPTIKARTAGYAYLPHVYFDYFRTQNGKLSDGDYKTNTGIVMNTSTALKTERYDILAHEMGHFMGLYHTFSSGTEPVSAESKCPDREKDPYKEGDRCGDTEPHYVSADITKANYCTSNTFTKWTSQNMMSYFSRATLFTPDQKNRMRVTLETHPFRASLLKSTVSDVSFASYTSMKPMSTSPKVEVWGHGPSYRFSMKYIKLGNTDYDERNYPGLFGGYHDLTVSHVARFSSGTSIPLAVDWHDSENAKKYAKDMFILGYVDYNNDGVFTRSEQIWKAHAGSSGTLAKVTGSFQPQSNAKKNTFLRVRFVSGYATLTARKSANDPKQTDTEVINKGCVSCKVVDLGLVLDDAVDENISLQLQGKAGILTNKNGALELSVSNSGAWKMDISGGGWLTSSDGVSATGTGNQTLTLNYAKNMEKGFRRCAKVVLSDTRTSRSASLDFCQTDYKTPEENSVWGDLPDQIELSNLSQSVRLPVQTTAPFWKISLASPNWVAPNSYIFSGNSNVQLLPDINPQSSARSIEMKIWEGETLKKTITLEQQALGEVLGIPEEEYTEDFKRFFPTLIENGQASGIHFEKKVSGTIAVYLSDMQGRIVHRQSLYLEDKRSLRIPLPDLQKGMYVLVAHFKNERYTTKLWMR